MQSLGFCWYTVRGAKSLHQKIKKNYYSLNYLLIFGSHFTPSVIQIIWQHYRLTQARTHTQRHAYIPIRDSEFKHYKDITLKNIFETSYQNK